MTDGFDFEDSRHSARGRSSDSIQRAFKAQVNKNIKLLSAKDPEVRREAAYVLGELGEPQAITALVRSYRKDKDRGVREAARYSLGMFRALEKALSGTEAERERALSLAESIITRGEIGKRSSLGGGLLPRIRMMLVASLIVLALLNVGFIVLKNLPQGASDETPTQVASANSTPEAGKEPAQVVEELRVLLGQLRGDASKLQRQMLNVQTGEALDCATEFANPLPYSLPADLQASSPDLVSASSQINSARLDLVTTKSIFDQACAEGAEPLTAEAVVAPLERITALLRTLSSLDPLLDAAQISGPTETPTQALPTETPTETPTLEPTATLSPATINNHIIGLDFIVEQMTDQRGAVKLLLQYWMDVRSSGVTAGCRPPYPTIPVNYPPLDASLAERLPQLQQAVDQVNTGLELARQGWAMFIDACNTNSLAAQLANGEVFAQTADSAFATSVGLLDEVKRLQREGS